MEKEKNKNESNVVEDNPRQQDKIIVAFERNDLYYLGHAFVRAEKSEHDNFIDSLADNKISDDDFAKMLQTIASPMDHALKSSDKMNGLFDSIAGDNVPGGRQMMGVLAYFSRHNMSERNDVNTDDLKSFYSMYPDPITFSGPVESFMEEFSKVNNDKKVAEYRQSIDSFERTIYGKRYEYSKQIELLKREATERKIGRLALDSANV